MPNAVIAMINHHHMNPFQKFDTIYMSVMVNLGSCNLVDRLTVVLAS